MALNSLAVSRPKSLPARPGALLRGGHRFGYLQGFSKSLRGLGVNTVEFVNSTRLGKVSKITIPTSSSSI